MRHQTGAATAVAGKTTAVVLLLGFTLFPVYFMLATAFNGGTPRARPR